jgi:hypothetical protein
MGDIKIHTKFWPKTSMADTTWETLHRRENIIIMNNITEYVLKMGTGFKFIDVIL